MTRFAADLACVHCGSEVDIPLTTVGGETDHWLSEDNDLRCAHCGGVNRVMVSENEAYFAMCVQRCAVCDVLAAASGVLDGPVSLDTRCDSLARVLVEMEVERALEIDIPGADRELWQTLRGLVAIVERMGAKA